jgi:hypothetical protein
LSGYSEPIDDPVVLTAIARAVNRNVQPDLSLANVLTTAIRLSMVYGCPKSFSEKGLSLWTDVGLCVQTGFCMQSRANGGPIAEVNFEWRVVA